MKYLIVKCEPLDDQWECDCYREPICIVDDWSKYASENDDEYFEVWEIKDGGRLELVKTWDNY